MSRLEQPLTDAAVTPESRRRRRRRHSSPLRRLTRILRRGRWGSIVIALLLLLVLAAVGGLVLATDARGRIDRTYDDLTRVLTSISAKSAAEFTLEDFNQLRASISAAKGTLSNLSGQLAFLGWLAPSSAEIAGSLTALDAARNLAAAGDTLLNGLQPTLFYLTSGNAQAGLIGGNVSGERALELLALGEPAFDEAEALLLRANEALEQIALVGVSDDLLLNVLALRGYADQLQTATHLLRGLPELLTRAFGLGGTQRYLVLSQNSDELRPSGGYISTYGWLTMRDGRIAAYDYQPTSATSPLPPPPEFGEQIAVPTWWIRYQAPLTAAWDGSWYADFPATAQMAAAYYDGGRNPQSPVDGVIGIDIAGFELILSALGEVRVPGYADVITSANFRRAVYDLRAFGREPEAHKQFLAALYRQIFAQLSDDERDAAFNSRLLGRLMQALREKHIMLYFRDSALQDAVERLGWAGAQVAPQLSDYLLAADANLGNKSNRSVARALTYDVAIQPDGGLRGRLTVDYDYPAAVAAADPAVNPAYHGAVDYRTLLQVFLPPGNELEAWQGVTLRDPALTNTPTHSLIHTMLEVPLGGTGRVQFSTRTPPITARLGARWRYHLLVQKQPGSLSDRLTVQVTLPPGARIIRSVPAPTATFALETIILEFQLGLTVDQTIDVIYSLANS